MPPAPDIKLPVWFLSSSVDPDDTLVYAIPISLKPGTILWLGSNMNDLYQRCVMEHRLCDWHCVRPRDETEQPRGVPQHLQTENRTPFLDQKPLKREQLKLKTPPALWVLQCFSLGLGILGRILFSSLTTIIKSIIPMALIQPEGLMVTLHKISCLLVSVQTEMSTCLGEFLIAQD